MKVKVIKTKNKKRARIGSAAARAPGSHGTLSLSCMRMFDWQRGWDDEGSRRCTVIQHTYLHSDEIYGEKKRKAVPTQFVQENKKTLAQRGAAGVARPIVVSQQRRSASLFRFVARNTNQAIGPRHSSRKRRARSARCCIKY